MAICDTPLIAINGDHRVIVPAQPRHIFLSHNRNHKPWVRRVAAQWRDLGLRVFFDEDSIEPGENLISAIERGISGCDHVVLMLSSDALASDWVAMEIAMTRTEDPSGKARKLIPVLIEPMDMDTIRPSIRCLNIVDLSQPEQRTQQYHHLLRSLGLDTPSLPAVPAFDDPAGGADARKAVPEEAPAKSGVRRVGIELTIDGDLEEFTAQQEMNLLAAIKALLGANEELTIRNIRSGSIILTLEISPDQADRLHRAVERGDLRDFGVRSARVLTELGGPPAEQKDARGVGARTNPSTRSQSHSSPEAIFLQHLGWIERVAATTCRRNGVREEDAEDFVSWVRMKLMEDDYAVVRKFRGESEIKTFIATVVVRYFHAYSREQRGRWRPSAAAEQIGVPARELETLVRRDGYTLEQAGEKLRTAGISTLSDAEMSRLLARLPERAPLRPVELPSDALDAAESPLRADERVAASDASTRHREILTAVNRAMEKLEPEDRLIVRMHFADGYTLAAVARALNVEQKPLYRRVHRLQLRVREYLEEEGVSSYTAHELLEVASVADAALPRTDEVATELPPREEALNAGVDPSLSTPSAADLDTQIQPLPVAETERQSGVTDALIRAIGHLTPEEQKIVGMHFEGRTFAQMAHALRLEPKWLYRRVERLRERLKTFLEE
ncbi:MAG TPA: sigma-70 family RNA polymerase sigma factor, partial [Longimicrobium sp.]|nr:sigma-70 family RNA polymerase sigma factor [Longimicrobium sp.]